MNYSFTRIASLVLAFGFFISCNALKSSTDNSNDNNQRDYSVTELEDEIEDINQQISSGDSTANLFYQKGSFLIKLAQKQDDPSNRTPYYEDAHKSLHQSADKLETNGSSDKALELLTVSWSNEHNEGVEIMQRDSTLSRSDFSRAAAHFKNATAIIPDSVNSYKMGARAYYKSQNTAEAIAMLEDARVNVSDVPSDIFEQLAFLYLENDQPQEAIIVYEEADSFSNQNLNVIHGLSNAYINAAEHRKAISLLEKLVDQQPENIIYKQSLATEYYYLASKKIDSLINERKSIDGTNSSFQTADSLLSSAEEHFSTLIDENPKNEELKQRIAQFYHNSASKYQQLLSHLDSEGPSDEVENKIEAFLTSSLPLFEELAETNPTKKEYWQNLYQAYTYLGMDAEAQNAKSNF